MAVHAITSNQRIFKNIISLVGGRMFISLSRLILSLIIVRLGNAEIFGSYVVVMSIIFMGEWLMDFGFTDIAVRDISQNEARRLSILDSFASIKLIQALIAFAMVVLVIHLLGYHDLLGATVVGGPALVFYGAAQIYRVNFRLQLTMYKDMLSESIGVAAMILLVIALSARGATITELVACHTFSRLVYFLANRHQGKRDYQPRFTTSDYQDIRLLIRQAAPLGIAGIVIACYDSIYPLLISKLLDMEAVALYTVAIRLVFPIVLVTQVIANVFYTPLADYWHADKAHFVSTQQNLVEITFYIACVSFCLLFSCAEIITWIFGEEMSAAAAVLRALTWAILARALTTTMALPIIICGGQKKTMWLTLMVVIASALLVLIMAPVYGIFGAVAAYLCAEIILSAGPVVYISQRMAGFRLDWAPMLKMFLAGIITLLVISLLALEGSVPGALLSIVLFMAISFLTGVITKRKVRMLIDIALKRGSMDPGITATTHTATGIRPTSTGDTPSGVTPLKVALVCPGAGLVQRGFERMACDLFKLLRDDVNLTFYKGGGRVSETERIPFFFSRNGRFLRYFPLPRLIGISNYRFECLTFAIGLSFALRGQGFDIVHCVDPPLTRILYRLRRVLGMNYRLLYTEATAMPPGHYPPADHMQQISRVTYDAARAYGLPEDYMTLISLGLYPERFDVGLDRRALRKKYAIPGDKFVILSLAALNRYHKRIDYLVDEVRSLDRDVLLWIDGSLDQGDPDLVEYARNALGERCRITHLPSTAVGELFAMADLMVHPALFEAFGLAMVEGASAGLPVLTHNAAHFLWLMDNPAAAIDMSKPLELARKLRELMDDPAQLASLKNSVKIRSRYDWQSLKKEYLTLYHETANLPASKIAVAHSHGLK